MTNWQKNHIYELQTNHIDLFISQLCAEDGLYTRLCSKMLNPTESISSRDFHSKGKNTANKQRHMWHSRFYVEILGIRSSLMWGAGSKNTQMIKGQQRIQYRWSRGKGQVEVRRWRFKIMAGECPESRQRLWVFFTEENWKPRTVLNREVTWLGLCFKALARLLLPWIRASKSGTLIMLIISEKDVMTNRAPEEGRVSDEFTWWFWQLRKNVLFFDTGRPGVLRPLRG
jgi:hypothetical protein